MLRIKDKWLRDIVEIGENILGLVKREKPKFRLNLGKGTKYFKPKEKCFNENQRSRRASH